MSFTKQFLGEVVQVAEKLNVDAIEKAASIIAETQTRQGRLFILGVGGSAGNASHAVNDFRKIAKIESYAPTDNVSELTAWINDDGWDGAFVNWLKGSRLRSTDLVLTYSVGAGSATTSANLVRAMEYAKE